MHTEERVEYNGKIAIIKETETSKGLESEGYNYMFDKREGVHIRWGKDHQDDPQYSPFGPEIADIEVSTNGCPDACPWCYKGNTNVPPTNMSLETFKQILAKLPRTLTQVALGITGVQTNPDLIGIIQHCRAQGIIPNFTLTGIDLDEKTLAAAALHCGAVAVSIYPHNKQLGYDTVNRCLKAGIKQTNVHLLVSKETINFVYEVIRDCKYHHTMPDLTAMVFLGLKPKGKAKGVYHPLSQEGYNALLDTCYQNQIPMGFDSCSAPKFIKWVAKTPWLTALEKRSYMLMAEPCESSLFSTYINVKGEVWNCSFCEDEEGVLPVNLLEVKDFLSEVWHSPEVHEFRTRVLENGRHCWRFPV